MCGTTKYVVVRTKDAIDWEKGKHIQDAFPYLSANDREALITGYCGPCWDREFDDPSGIH